MKTIDTRALELRLLSEVMGREGRLVADARATGSETDDHEAATTALTAAQDALEDAVDGVRHEVARGVAPTLVDILEAHLALHRAVTCLADAVEAILDAGRNDAEG